MIKVLFHATACPSPRSERTSFQQQLHRPTVGRCWGCSRRIGAACAPRMNPQNVDEPLVGPSSSLSSVDAVRVQLDALRRNDEPWTNHGLQTCYEFAEDAGGMEMSYYFGFRKDLYHFDHFMGLFGSRLGPLVDLQTYEILDEGVATVSQEPNAAEAQAHNAGESLKLTQQTVCVRVTDGRGDDAGLYTFTLVQRKLGRRKGSWMTKSLTQSTDHS